METTWFWSFLGLLGVPLFVAMNGLFVAAEFALVAVRKRQGRHPSSRARAIADSRCAASDPRLA